MFCREMDSSNRTETHTSPPLHQIVHLSGSELVQLLDLSSPLKGRFGERACCYRVGDLMACNHRCASSRDDHKIEKSAQSPIHCNDAIALTIPAATG